MYDNFFLVLNVFLCLAAKLSHLRQIFSVVDRTVTAWTSENWVWFVETDKHLNDNTILPSWNNCLFSMVYSVQLRSRCTRSKAALSVQNNQDTSRFFKEYVIFYLLMQFLFFNFVLITDYQVVYFMHLKVHVTWMPQSQSNRQ